MKDGHGNYSRNPEDENWWKGKICPLMYESSAEAKSDHCLGSDCTFWLQTDFASNTPIGLCVKS